MSEIVPEIKNGHASKYNQRTKIVTLNDLPKIDKTFTWDSPNFGDWSKGSHEVERTMKVRQKVYFEPLFLSLGIEKLKETDKEIGFKFTINRLLSKTNKSFEVELLRDLNLLQENIGSIDVYDGKAEAKDYLADLQLNWEILPPGTKDEIISSVCHGGSYTKAEEREITHRYEVINNLHPISFIKGTSGMQRYFGARFTNNLVAFENIKYGNAIYIMKNNWELLSKLSRIELMKSHRGDFIRIVHRKGWERQFEYFINKLRKES